MSKSYDDCVSTRIRTGNSTPAEDYMADAAPALLAALEGILDLPTDDDGDRIIPPGYLDEARAAVAKAKGT